MITLIVTLAVIGICLYLVESLPMDATIRIVIRVVVVIAVILFLLRAFGISDFSVPRLR